MDKTYDSAALAAIVAEAGRRLFPDWDDNLWDFTRQTLSSDGYCNQVDRLDRYEKALLKKQSLDSIHPKNLIYPLN